MRYRRKARDREYSTSKRLQGRGTAQGIEKYEIYNTTTKAF
jgi:hypothetical protein